jgi:3-oxoadipate CoA-transferase alpha subunit
MASSDSFGGQASQPGRDQYILESIRIVNVSSYSEHSIRPNLQRSLQCSPRNSIEHPSPALAQAHRRPASAGHAGPAVIDKIVASVAEALADIRDGSTIMIGGFGGAGMPTELIDGLIEQGARDLTIVNNNAGNGDTGLAALLAAGRVRKIVCSFPRQVDSHVFDGLYRAGKIELELVPQGNLAERIRAAGAGIPAFYTATGYGTELARGKETRVIGGRPYVLEYALSADVALIKAERGDRWGNLTYRKSARNFGPIMASAARLTIASVYEVVPLGGLDPEIIVTPGIFVQRVVPIARRAQSSAEERAA